MSESDFVYSNDTSVYESEEEELLGAAGGNYTPNQPEPIVLSGEIYDEEAEGRMAIDDYKLKNEDWIRYGVLRD